MNFGPGSMVLRSVLPSMMVHSAGSEKGGVAGDGGAVGGGGGLGGVGDAAGAVGGAPAHETTSSLIVHWPVEAWYSQKR